MYPFIVAYISIHPYPELLKGGWSAIRIQNVSNQTPDISSHMTVKEQVLNAFKCITEKHLLSPCQFLLQRLSLVKTTFPYISHTKILIFRGILASQSPLLGLFVSKLKKCLYIDLIENFSDFSQVYFTLSFSLERAQ
jgi:hypothetical protein